MQGGVCVWYFRAKEVCDKNGTWNRIIEVNTVMRNELALFNLGCLKLSLSRCSKATVWLLVSPISLLCVSPPCMCVCGTVPQGSPSSPPLTSEQLWSWGEEEGRGVRETKEGRGREGEEWKMLGFLFSRSCFSIIWWWCHRLHGAYGWQSVSATFVRGGNQRVRCQQSALFRVYNALKWSCWRSRSAHE